MSDTIPATPANQAGREEPRRIAVVIPCFDDGAVVSEAVASVGAMRDVEIVVVDDGSSAADTLTVLDGLAQAGVVVLHQENRGLSRARMAGVGATSAPYVFNLDADDRAVAETLARMADLLDADPQAAFCYGNYREFGDSELVRTVPEGLDPFRLAYTNEYPVTALFRRDALEAVGGWQHLGAGYEDWDLWLRLAERGYRGIHAGAGAITFERRLHGTRMLGRARLQHRALYRLLRQRHPLLFDHIATHRRASEMPAIRKALYPILYGGRPRFRFEPKAKALLDRLGVWTLRG